MLPKIRLGRTNLEVTRLGLGGYPFAGVNRAQGWDPYTPEGRATAVRTIQAALDAGISYIDTAPAYGHGHSESIIGEATAGRRAEFVLATKVGSWEESVERVATSVEESLRRLRTDVIDIIQFHGGMFTAEDVARLLSWVEELVKLRERGLVRFLGFTVEEPWTARPLIASGVFDMMQIRYNLMYQSAAEHALNDAKAQDMGVTVMRPLTSGIFQRLASYLAPQWSQEDLYALALKFVLSDSRVHLPNVGMRWPEEVAKNVALVESFVPAFDMAELPRGTAAVYETDDAMNLPRSEQ